MIPAHPRSALAIGLTLALVMAATRSHHFATRLAFARRFLGGVLCRRILSSSPMDLSGVAGIGRSERLRGHHFVRRQRFLHEPRPWLLATGLWLPVVCRPLVRGPPPFRILHAGPVGGSLFLGAAVCELISSGGFYFFSGRFAETSLIEFGRRLAKYFPLSLESVAFWVGIAMVLHILFTLAASNFMRARHQKAG